LTVFAVAARPSRGVVLLRRIVLLIIFRRMPLRIAVITLFQRKPPSPNTILPDKILYRNNMKMWRLPPPAILRAEFKRVFADLV
jgi:hypothetical protein